MTTQLPEVLNQVAPSEHNSHAPYTICPQSLSPLAKNLALLGKSNPLLNKLKPKHLSHRRVSRVSLALGKLSLGGLLSVLGLSLSLSISPTATAAPSYATNNDTATNTYGVTVLNSANSNVSNVGAYGTGAPNNVATANETEAAASANGYNLARHHDAWGQGNNMMGPGYDPNYNPNYGPHHGNNYNPNNYYPNQAGPNYIPQGPSYGMGRQGGIAACIAAKTSASSWGDDMPVSVTMVDGYGLSAVTGGMLRRNLEDLYLIVNWGRGQSSTVLELGNRDGFNRGAMVLKDIQGQEWRISRTWRRCSR